MVAYLFDEGRHVLHDRHVARAGDPWRRFGRYDVLNDQLVLGSLFQSFTEYTVRMTNGSGR